MGSRNSEINQYSSRLIIRFLIIFISLTLLIGLITALIYYMEVYSEKARIEANEKTHVDILTKTIATDFKSVVSDLIILSECNYLQEFLENGKTVYIEAVAKEFLIFSDSKGLYDQIRFLDETGMEVVRVNYNNGSPSIVSEDQLQDKSKRYYFQDAFQLGKGEVYVSPLDLNIEEEKIEQPLKPMIRISTPVFDKSGEKRGIIILNYFGANIIDHLEREPGNKIGQMMLINPQGYWLKGLKPEDEWGFMYEDRHNRTFGSAYPEAWEQISRFESGQFHTADGLFTFVTVYPYLEAQKTSPGSGKANEPSPGLFDTRMYYWKIVSHLPLYLLTDIANRTLRQLLLLDALFIVIVAGFSWYSAIVIVRRNKTEKTMTQLRHKLELILNSAGEGIYGLNREGNTTFANPAAASMLGFKIEELVGKSMHDLIHHTKIDGTPYPKEECPTEMAINEKVVHHSRDEVFWRNDGSNFPVEYVSTPIVENGNVFGAVVVFKDITERKETEEKLRESGAILKSISKASPIGIGMLVNRVFTYMNDEMCKIVGYSKEELLGKSARIVYPDDKEFERVGRIKYAEITELGIGEIETKFKCKDGRIIDVWLSSSPIDPSDFSKGVVFTAMNITDSKKTEEALKDYAEELEHSNRLKDLYADIMRHDIMVPLNIASGITELEKEEEKNKDKLNNLSKIEKNLQKALDMIENARILAKLEAKSELEYEEIDLNSCITEVIQMYKTKADEKGIEMEYLVKGKYFLKANMIIEQVFNNLISNAIKYSPPDTRITIDTTEEEKIIIVKVADQGEGIPDEYKINIFERFERIDKEGVKGTGLGLGIVKKIVDIHQGKVWVEDNPDGGSVFVVELPKEHERSQSINMNEEK